MRASRLWVISMLLVVGGCGERNALPLDALVVDAGQGDAPPAADAPTGDADPVTLDRGGGGFVYHGKIELGEGVDPRINSPGWVVARVGFATAFYESAFSATLTAGACRFGEMVPPPPAITNFEDAGAVQVSGGVQPLSFTYRSDDYYSSSVAPGTYSLFEAGQTLGASAAGGPTLPAFSASVPAPASLVVKSPDLMQMTTTLSTTADYTVTWTPSSADRVRVVIRCPGPGGERRVECDSSDDGQLVLQAAVLKALAPHCTASKAAEADFIRLNERHVEQGDLRVTLSASTLVRGGLVFTP